MDFISPGMRLLALNIGHGGGGRVARIAQFVAKHEPDTVVISEFRDNRRGLELRHAFCELGLTWQAASSAAPTQNCVCIAANAAFVLGDMGSGGSHRLLHARFATHDVLGVYFPQKQAKRAVFDLVRTEILPALSPSAVLIGDFNTGLHFEDESGSTFQCVESFAALLSAGIIDAWRARNPSAREFSWFSCAGNGFRVDHALVTPEFDRRIRHIRYVHDCRTSVITDHSAIVVDHDA